MTTKFLASACVSEAVVRALGNSDTRSEINSGGISLGRYPALPVDKARAIAADHHAAVRLGRDPAGEKQEGRANASDTFDVAARLFLAIKKEKLKPRTYVEVERHLLTNSTSLNALQLRKITRSNIATLLTQLSAGHTPRVADAVHSSLRWQTRI
jgi:hypothetical protein